MHKTERFGKYIVTFYIDLELVVGSFTFVDFFHYCLCYCVFDCCIVEVNYEYKLLCKNW